MAIEYPAGQELSSQSSRTQCPDPCEACCAIHTQLDTFQYLTDLAACSAQICQMFPELRIQFLTLLVEFQCRAAEFYLPKQDALTSDATNSETSEGCITRRRELRDSNVSPQRNSEVYISRRCTKKIFE